MVTYKRSYRLIDDLGHVDLGQVNYQIKNEGVYLFGGVFGRSSGEQRLNDKMLFLPIGKGVSYRWRELETHGKGPEGRYHHSIHFYEKGNYVVVFGGRRFAKPDPSVKIDSPEFLKAEFVEGISLLRVDSLEWHEVKYKQSNKGDSSFPLLFNFSCSLIED